MRAIRTLAVAAAAAAAFTANAGVILVDNFSTPSIQTIIDPAPAGSTAGPAAATCATCLATSRQITADMTVGPAVNAGLAQSVTVGSGAFPASALTFSTGSQVDQTVRVTWTLPPVALGGVVQLFFRILDSNIGLLASGGTEQNMLSFSLNGASLGSASFGNQVNQDLFINLNAAQVASLAGGGSLVMTADGAPGWDLSLTSFGFNVPEPTSLALVGLGLLGAGLVSRRKAR